VFARLSFEEEAPIRIEFVPEIVFQFKSSKPQEPHFQI